jgi:ubiquitin C-terminal hydrolase
MPQGIANLGNTCFLNSLLQCLRISDPWMQWLEKNQALSKSHPFFKHLYDTMFDPMPEKSLIYLILKIQGNLGVGQIDPSHAFECIMAMLTSELAETEQLTFEQLFYTTDTLSTMCGNCHRVSTRSVKTPLLTLHGYEWQSLSDVFNQCFDPLRNISELDAENKYFCERCGDKERAFQTTVISNLPEMLVLVAQNREHGMRATDKLTFKKNHYECVGIVSHSGLDGMGQCIAHTKTDQGWYVCNDEHVRPISEQELNTTTPYLLFMVLQGETHAVKQ